MRDRPRGRHRLSFALAAAIGLSAGCEQGPQPATDAARTRTLLAVPLPEVRADIAGVVEPRARVVITASGIDADNMAVVDAWPREMRDAFLQSLPPDESADLPFEHQQLVKLSGWAMAPPDLPGPGVLEIRPLLQVLDYAARTERSYGARFGATETRPKLNLYADRGAPFALVVRALASAMRAEYGETGLVVRGPRGDAVLPVQDLRTMMRVPGPTPWVHVLPTGVSIRILDNGYSSHAERWQGRTVLASAGACPSVPRRDGHQDLDGIAALLRGLARAVPTCEDVRVTVAEGTTWGEVADVLANVLAAVPPDSDAPRLDLTALDEAPGAECRDGITLDELLRPVAVSESKGGITGGSVSGAQFVVARMAAGFRRCYNKGLQEDPNMKGSVRVTAKIGPDGEVLSTNPVGTGLSATVVACVAARVSSAQFAPPTGGGATLVIPVTFVSQ